ncbi:MAG: hypothetical protein E7035_02625 [Verrucomicrobiaceae bacterium]|nr:hypothetical protein [Verrucomicrobiaceae bacterium]
MKKSLIYLILYICTFSVGLAQKIGFSVSDFPEQINAGQNFTITARFEIPQGLHIYPQKTEIGMPTKIEVLAPKGIILKSIEFPPTSKFTFMGMTADGYSESFNAKLIFSTTQSLQQEKQKIQIKASWLACSNTCIPEEKTQSITIDVISNRASKNIFFVSILGAILGGLILNVMPCVFPVISLKIMSFASATNSSKSLITAKSLIFSLGIILSFAILGIILASIKYFGGNVGWGFQLQSPMFTKIMTIIFWFITLNFAGVWEFGNSISAVASGIRTDTSNKWIASFMSGVLAVLVASPCVAPFMASAVGYALTGNASAGESIAIITSVGIGMAIPYILLAQFPSLLKKLPRPGRWLDVLKKILSIPMLITVIWLAWVMNNQGNSILNIFIMLITFFAVAVIWGKYANPMQSKKTRIIAVVVCILLAIFGSFINIKFGEDKVESSWNQQEVENLLSQGKNVFVDFTASWCFTCQYNKQIIFSEKTKKLFKEKNVEILVADWTNKDDSITKELRKYGRAGVPLYLLFSAKDKTNPQILPTILTQSIMSEAIDKIKQ